MARDEAGETTGGAGARALSELMALRPEGAAPEGELTTRGADPVFATPFAAGEAAAAVIGAIGVAVNDVSALRGDPRRALSIDVAQAAATLRPWDHVLEDDGEGGLAPPADLGEAPARKCTWPWPTKDGRHFLPHLNLPELQKRVLGVLGCGLDPEEVRAAVGRWNALELEEAIAEARACGSMTRTEAEWRAHPHGQALAARPVISIERIGDAPPEPCPGRADRPLAGLRVLDLTRILAGPVAARTLGEHGADVLAVAAERLPQVAPFVRDTGHGKRSAFLDLDLPEDTERLRALTREADVFSQGYRPGALAKRGFGPEDLAALRPGIVCVSISCYGHGGPLEDRAGWEQVAQSATGICAEQGAALGGPPALLPAAVCDFVTGYMGALGALLALGRRAREGGSWHVQVSLCRTAMFLQDIGRAPFEASRAGDLPGPSAEQVASVMAQSQGARGRLRFVGPVLRMEGAPPHHERQAPLLGADAAEWLPRD